MGTHNANAVFSVREAWAASFFEKGSRSELIKLSENGSIVLFMSKPKIHAEHHPIMLDMHPPTYYVWSGNNWLYCGPNLTYASDLYGRILQGGENDA